MKAISIFQKPGEFGEATPLEEIWGGIRMAWGGYYEITIGFPLELPSLAVSPDVDVEIRKDALLYSAAGPFAVTPDYVYGSEACPNPGFETAGARSEKLLNPGFETLGGGGADIWADWSELPGSGTLADDMVKVHGGLHAVKITQGASLDALLRQQVAVDASTQYTLYFYTSGDGTNAGRINIYDVTHSAWIVAGQSTGISGTTYAEGYYSFATPAGCTSIYIDLSGGAANGAVCYFDDVSLMSQDFFGSWNEHVPSATSRIERSADSPHGGTYSAKLTGSSWGTTLYVAVTVPQGADVRLTFWTKGDGTHDGGYYVTDGYWNPIVATVRTNVTAAVWTKVTVDFSNPADNVLIVVGLTYGPGTFGTVWFDDVSVKTPELLTNINMETSPWYVSADHETGDMSQYNAATAVAATEAKHGGSYGMKVAMNASSYGEFWLTSKPRAVLETWFHQNTASVGNDAVLWFVADGVHWRWFVSVMSNAIKLGMTNDADVWTWTGGGSLSAGWHHVRGEFQASSAPGANNGWGKVYVDGVLVASISGLDNDTAVVASVGFGDPGAYYGGTGYYYLDDCRVFDNSIEVPLTDWSTWPASASVQRDVTKKVGGLASARLANTSPDTALMFKYFTLTQGNWYRYAVSLYWQSGGEVASFVQENFGTWKTIMWTNQTAAAWKSYVGTGSVRHTGYPHAVNAAYVWSGNTVGNTDNASFKQLDLATMITGVQDVGADVSVYANLTLGLSLQAGVVVGLDNEAAPQNFILVYLNRFDDHVHVDEYVGGAMTELADVAVTYTAGGTLKVSKVGTRLTVFYKGVQVGTAVTLAANTHTKIGLFASASSASISTFNVYEAGETTFASLASISPTIDVQEEQ